MRSAWPGYLEVRRDDTALAVPRLLLSAPGQRPWSLREVSAELRDLAADSDDFPFIPQRDLGVGRDALGKHDEGLAREGAGGGLDEAG